MRVRGAEDLWRAKRIGDNCKIYQTCSVAGFGKSKKLSLYNDSYRGSVLDNIYPKYMCNPNGLKGRNVIAFTDASFGYSPFLTYYRYDYLALTFEVLSLLEITMISTEKDLIGTDSEGKCVLKYQNWCTYKHLEGKEERTPVLRESQLLVSKEIFEKLLSEIGNEPYCSTISELIFVNSDSMRGKKQEELILKTGRNDTCPCGSGKKYKHCCLDKKKDVDKPFILTKEVYETDFLPAFRIERTLPKSFIEYEIVLPFHIPFHISRTITLSFENEFLSFRFDMVTTNESYKYPFEGDMPILNVHKTKMLMMAATEIEYEKLIDDKETYWNKYFDLLLEELNKIIISYMTTKKDVDCHYVTKEMLQASILVRMTNLDTWENDMGLFMLHMNVPYEKDPLSDKEIEEIIRLYGIVSYDLNPFADGEQFALSARRYFKQGFYLEAVIYAQTSVEVLIRTLFQELLKTDGASEDEIKDSLESTSFMAIIKKKLPAYLGGCWDVTKSDSEVGKWYENTYELRNRATHRGRIPSFREADSAICDAIEFRKFVVDRVKANKKKYPQLDEFFV